jgi:radical SAM superfamily enzyme YgiQ (UPF0313 family)
MNVLFANVPFVRYEGDQIFTGPNAGSRWPWTLPGETCYACFPFFLAYAASFLQEHGVEVGLYDGVARKQWDYPRVIADLISLDPKILVLEISTPLADEVLAVAEAVKGATGCKVVMVGPHVATYAEELAKKPFVDHCVRGEYENACLAIARGSDQRIFDYWPVDNIDTINGKNWLPYYPADCLHNYLEPTQRTPPIQHQVSTSRGCAWKCTFCQWPEVMNNRKYRVRKPEFVIDEVRRVRRHFGVGSILFDDDTWNIGTKRVAELCAGLKEIGVPWSMMGRTDASSLESFQWMADAGCIGMRFGVESFHQHLLDTVEKHMDAQKNFENLEYLVTNLRGIEFHLTTMREMPGEKPGEWEQDLKKLEFLARLAHSHGNVLHWQNSVCQTFPGTKLWQKGLPAKRAEVSK